MTDFFERFLACERREGLFHRAIGGVRYWHLIRFRVFNDLVLPHFIQCGAPHPDYCFNEVTPSGRWIRVKNRLTAVCTRLAETLWHDPDGACLRRPILFSMIPRQGVMANGRVGSTQLDVFSPLVRSSYALLEHPGVRGYTQQPWGRKVFHWPMYASIRNARLSAEGDFAREASLRKAESECLATVLERAYGFSFESGRIWWMIDDYLRFRVLYGDAMRRWLERLGVRVLVHSDAEYRNNALLTEAAHDLGIPVVELQHGTVYPEHMAYNLGEGGSIYSPDYFFAWGAHWKGQLRNYVLRQSIAVGYPFLDSFVDVCRRVPRKDGAPLRVLFISQGPIGAELSKIAVEMRRRFPSKTLEMVYKLHPNETRSWRMLYPELETSGIRVVGNDELNIYQCLQRADVTVGTNSTAMIEGLAWGVRAMVMKNLPAGFTMESFCRSGGAEFIEDAEHLARRIGELAACAGKTESFAFDDANYFLTGAAARIAGHLDDLAAGKDICP